MGIKAEIDTGELDLGTVLELAGRALRSHEESLAFEAGLDAGIRGEAIPPDAPLLTKLGHKLIAESRADETGVKDV